MFDFLWGALASYLIASALVIGKHSGEDLPEWVRPSWLIGASYLGAIVIWRFVEPEAFKTYIDEHFVDVIGVACGVLFCLVFWLAHVAIVYGSRPARKPVASTMRREA